MQRTTGLKPGLQTLSFTSARLRPLSTTPRFQGLFTKDRDDTLDPAKEDTDTIRQAKNTGGNNPAQQHAKVSGHQSPQGKGTGPDSGGSNSSSAGLGTNNKANGEKPGEEAVNPAVKGS